MKGLEETHGPNFELLRHFLTRMFDSELFSTQGQWRTVAINAFALALPAGMVLFSPESGSKHRLLVALHSPEALRQAGFAGEFGLLLLIMSITGLLIVMQWHSLYPSGRDYLALAGLPVRSRQIFGARFACVMLLSTVLITALNLLPVLIMSARFARGHPFSAAVAAQAASSALACFFMFFAVLALYGLLLNTLPGRLFARISTGIQSALTAVLFLGALIGWSIPDWNGFRLDAFGTWMPAVWFTGLHDRMLGDSDPWIGLVAGRALWITLAAAALACGTYFLSYRRYRSLLVEASIYGIGTRMRRPSLLRLLARDPRKQAVLQFMQATLARSRMHRMILLAYAGGAVGVMLNSSLIAGAALKWSDGWRGAVKFMVLYWPIGISFIMLAGLRHVFSIPAELPANWLFRTTESDGRAQWMSAVERFVIGGAIAPLYGMLFPLSVLVLGWGLALRMTVLEVLVSLAAFEFLFYSWQQLPFACSYVPGKRPLWGVVASYTVVLFGLVPVLARIVAGMSVFLGTFIVYGAIFAAVWLWARKRRRDGWGESCLIYEDIPDALPDLGIREVGYSRRQAEGPGVPA